MTSQSLFYLTLGLLNRWSRGTYGKIRYIFIRFLTTFLWWSSYIRSHTIFSTETSIAASACSRRPFEVWRAFFVMIHWDSSIWPSLTCYNGNVKMASGNSDSFVPVQYSRYFMMANYSVTAWEIKRSRLSRSFISWEVSGVFDPQYHLSVLMGLLYLLFRCV